MLFIDFLTFLVDILGKDGRGLYTARISIWCLQRHSTSWTSYSGEQ